MKSIEKLITKLRGEMSTRIDDADIVEILDVLQEADKENEKLKRALRSCKYHAENIIKSEYNESSDALEIIEEVERIFDED